MASRNKNYVGVSSASSVEDVKSMVKLIQESGFTMQTKHIPMMGFQISQKGVLQLDQLPSMLESVKGEVFTTTHHHIEMSWQLVHEIVTVLDYEGIYKNGLIGGIQINGAFPFPFEVKKLKDDYPELRITLQVHPNKDSVKDMAKYLAKNYKEVDYVIIDPSEGKGIELDVAQTARIYNTLKDNGFNANIVLTGNLNGDNVSKKVSEFKELLKSDDFSLDAESGVRGTGKVKSYLRGAAEGLLEKKVK